MILWSECQHFDVYTVAIIEGAKCPPPPLLSPMWPQKDKMSHVLVGKLPVPKMGITGFCKLVVSLQVQK